MTDPATRSAEPRTEAGKRLLNDVREVVVYGVTDRIRPGYDLAWHVARGITEVEREASESAPDPGLLREAAREVVTALNDTSDTDRIPPRLMPSLVALRAALSAAPEQAGSGLQRWRLSGGQMYPDPTGPWLREAALAATPVADPSPASLDAELLARLFHETYERLAPEFGYETRKASAVPWADVPIANKMLMEAVARVVLAALRGTEPRLTDSSEPPNA